MRLLFLAALVLLPQLSLAQEIPSVGLQVGDVSLTGGGSMNSMLKISFFVAALSFLPAVVLCMTCFTRIAVVLGITRTALGTASLPPNMVITGLALFLTIAIMKPVFNEMYTLGVEPYLAGQMDDAEAFRKAIVPMKKFLVNNSREKDLALFIEITDSEMPNEVEDISLIVAVPAFVLTELNLAFQIGFMIALPFLVLDMVVSSVLTSMSMITLPPVVISLPLKLMLFVLVDGWHLIISSLVKTYQV